MSHGLGLPVLVRVRGRVGDPGVPGARMALLRPRTEGEVIVPERPLSVPIDDEADGLVSRFGVSPSLDAHIWQLLHLGELARNMEDRLFNLEAENARLRKENIAVKEEFLRVTGKFYQSPPPRLPESSYDSAVREAIHRTITERAEDAVREARDAER